MKEISTEELRDRLENGDLVVLDVREPHEVAQAAIKGSVSIPLGQVVERRGELDATRTTAVVCAAGVRSARAIEALTELDLARERPELADTLTDLVTAVIDPRLLPPSLDARRRVLLERSLRLAAICELALADDGASSTALQAGRRAQVLRPLLRTARRGVAAATECWGPRQR